MFLWMLFSSVGFLEASPQKSVYECPELQTISPRLPIDTSSIYTFPTRAFTQFPAKTTCSWIVNIPDNFTVIVQLKATIPDGGHVTITQAPFLNQTEKFVKDMEVTRFFISPSFDIFWYPGPSENGNLKFSLHFQNTNDVDLNRSNEGDEEEQY